MKIGLAVLTYQRPECLKRCLESLESTNWAGATERFVVVDEPRNETYDLLWKLHTSASFYFGPNRGCAKAKNQALRLMMEAGCDHLFILEDDQIMLDPKTCEKYIEYAKEKKLQHLNYAHHGKQADIQVMIEFKGISCYPDCVGAFSYYTRECIERVGYMDENFYNAWEHVEHTYRIAKAGLTTPFWLFADHPDSMNMVEEQADSIGSSRIRVDPKWRRKMEEGIEYWTKKHGHFILPRPDLKALAQDPSSGLRVVRKPEKRKRSLLEPVVESIKPELD